MRLTRKTEPIRLNAQSTAIENGFVYLPREAHWLEVFCYKLMTFPWSRYADQIDSTFQALAYLTGQNRIAGQGRLDYAAHELARMRSGTP